MKGFSLVELLICCAIVFILSSWALPGYQQWLFKQSVREGQAMLLDIQLQQEAFRMQHSRFAKKEELVIPAHDIFQFKVTDVTATKYTITAEVSDLTLKGEDCASFGLTQSLEKFPDHCW